MDDPTAIGKALEKSIEAAIEPAKKFVEVLAGPGVEEIGLSFQDRARFRRFKNQVRMLAKAEAFVKEAGFTLHSVPIKTLFPLLEGASLEEDDDMQERWAALLANAADPEAEVTIHPTFPAILKALSTKEAKLLDRVFEKTHKKAGREVSRGEIRSGLSEVRFELDDLGMMFSDLGLSPVPWPQTLEDAWEGHGAVEADLVKTVDVLVSHRLFEIQQIITRPPFFVNGHVKYEHKNTYGLTLLGYAFVTACRRPRKKKD